MLAEVSLLLWILEEIVADIEMQLRHQTQVLEIKQCGQCRKQMAWVQNCWYGWHLAYHAIAIVQRKHVRT